MIDLRFAGSLALALLLLSVSACGPDEPAVEPEAGAETTYNTLTEAEEAEGWQLLFDGETMANWRGFRSNEIPQKWEIQDGALYFTGSDDSTLTGGDIITAQPYENFELELDWKISECGNSGIMFHVAPAEEGYDQTWRTGPEYQVLDNTCHPDAENGRDRYAGTNYALHVPDSTVYIEKPAGQWNHTRIVVQGPHVEHWLNGQKIVEYELWSDDWNQRVANSKFGEMPDYGQKRRGHIALQDHGDPVWYRNIKIRPLPSGSAA